MILRDWLREKPFSLCLSSGFFGFFAHAGFITALEEAGIRPKTVSGSSAGALVAGFWAAGMSVEAIRRELMSLKREDFWDPGFGAGLLKGRLFREKLERLLPVKKFEKCSINLKVSAYDVLKRKTTVFDSGELSTAIHASCAVPVMFQPVWIGRRPYLDGGIADRPAMQGVSPDERVFYHHLESRSWWRREGSIGTQVPRRDNMKALIIKNLPTMGPDLLHLGSAAFQQGYSSTVKALNSQVTDTEIWVD